MRNNSGIRGVTGKKSKVSHRQDDYCHPTISNSYRKSVASHIRDNTESLL